MGMADPEPDHECVCLLCVHRIAEAERTSLRETIAMLVRAIPILQDRPGPTWTPTDDPDITCVVCGGAGVSHEAGYQDGGARTWFGLHLECRYRRALDIAGVQQLEAWRAAHPDASRVYAGRHVAFVEGLGIVASGASIDEVRDELLLIGIDRSDVLFSRIHS